MVTNSSNVQYSNVMLSPTTMHVGFFNTEYFCLLYIGCTLLLLLLFTMTMILYYRIEQNFLIYYRIIFYTSIQYEKCGNTKHRTVSSKGILSNGAARKRDYHRKAALDQTHWMHPKSVYKVNPNLIRKSGTLYHSYYRANRLSTGNHI